MPTRSQNAFLPGQIGERLRGGPAGLAVIALVLGAFGEEAQGRGTAAPAVGASVTFTDVAGRSRFPYVTNNDYTGRKYLPQPMWGASR